ncbi:divergent polysaccharide deacetylase family protein [Oceanobacillus chungangensis]|uniref:Divergent polysaccharide deacetylase family protein n=1 Tax=Oceanobacillus chungangensis TaxID=1229152 RepID=A0A3D8PXS9_9BACI|nr:divergent polysaccharide deacetylase family protein [Oceanobacillus chungangensis]RDW19949.1 hypothetical protein CWR45_07785 [Oceanobacillus chungangensis]
MRILICSFLFLFLFVQPVFAEPTPQLKKELAIVIDDLGNNMKGTKEILSLPVKLTVAIMPFMPSTKEDAELANENGHEVIIHLPMEPKKGKKSWLGPGAITSDLSDQEIRERVESAIKDVPHAVGMNNHMGSKITEDERIMKIILEVCRENALYFLDSQTTENSVVSEVGAQMNVPVLENNLFFDAIYTAQHIKKQADLLSKQLIDHEKIIAIGHVGVPGPMTFSVLKEYIPVYQNQAEFVSLTDLIPEFNIIDGIESSNMVEDD